MKFVAATFCIAVLAAATSTGSEGEDHVRKSIERALPYLETEGTWWIEEKECVSCHHSTFFVWAKDLALQRGFPIEKGSLEEQRAWVLESLLAPLEPDPKQPDTTPGPEEVKGDRNVEGVSQFLLSPSASQVSEADRHRLLEVVARNRGDDGTWSPGGQLPRQKRPEAETRAVSGQWALAALGEKPPAAPDFEPVTTEWFALEALLRGDREAIDRLLARQNEDGGWSWIDGEASDPEATGQALFGLARGGSNDGALTSAIARGRSYLVTHQAEDGHWETKSTKDRAKSTRVSDFWGSVWAVIGLLETTP